MAFLRKMESSCETGSKSALYGYPPVANQWAAIEDCSIAAIRSLPTHISTYDISGWELKPEGTWPQPGWIIAHPKPGDSGHCGVIDYDGLGLGAGTSGTVNKNYEEFSDGTSRYRAFAP